MQEIVISVIAFIASKSMYDRHAVCTSDRSERRFWLVQNSLKIVT